MTQGCLCVEQSRDDYKSALQEFAACTLLAYGSTWLGPFLPFGRGGVDTAGATTLLARAVGVGTKGQVVGLQGFFHVSGNCLAGVPPGGRCYAAVNGVGSRWRSTSVGTRGSRLL